MSQEYTPNLVEQPAENAAPIEPSVEVLSGENAPGEASVVQLVPAEVSEALKHIENTDTYDMYRKRLNGTSVLIGRAMIPGAPTAVMASIFESRNFGPQTVILTGSAVAAGAATVALVAYGGKRCFEQSRAAKRERDQDVIRDYLQEPVDVVRGKKRGQFKGTTLRWYGADEAFSEEADTANIASRFGKIVEFAGEQKINSVVVSAGILEHIPEKAKQEELSKQLADKGTTTEEVFAKAKGGRVDDRNADPKLLRLTPDEAQSLLQEMGQGGEVSKIKLLASLLAGNSADPHITALIREWKTLGEPQELLGSLKRLLAGSIDRRLNKNVEFNATTTRYEGFIKDSETGELTEADWRMATATDGILSTRREGVHEQHSAMLPDDTYYANGQLRPFSDFTARGETPEELIETYVKLLKVNPVVKGKDGKETVPHIDDVADLEIALYAQLYKLDEKIKGAGGGVFASGRGGNQPTLYERMIQERPRGFLRPWTANRGKVPKAEQTIEYGRRFWRNFGKKVGAVALTVGLSGIAGYGMNKAWGQYEMWEFDCGPKRVSDEPLTKKEQAACDAAHSSVIHAVGGVGGGIYDLNTEYENWIATRLYASGVLTPENLNSFSSIINKEWAEKKFNDLVGRYNLYDGDYTPISDAAVDATGNGTPVIWSLTPQNGATTEGYWPTGTQDQIDVDTSILSGQTQTPPLSEVSLNITDSVDYLVPIGMPPGPGIAENEVTHFRTVPLTEQPPESDRPLIRVQGRQLTYSLNSMTIPPNSEDALPTETVGTLRLPVKAGGSIVAASFIIKDLATDKIVENIEPQVYQRTDGTFGAIIDTKYTDPKYYIDVDYWVDPNATDDLPLKAERPMTIRDAVGDSIPLTQAYTEADVAKVRASLNLPANATLDQIAAAIKTTRGYSYTPYKDSGKEAANKGDLNTSTIEATRLVADYAADMSLVHCNLAMLLEIYASRGQDSDEFANKVSGFRNSDKDSKLNQLESHVYTVTDTGRTIDPTPDSKPDKKAPSVRGYEESPQSSSETVTQDLLLGAISLATFAAGFGAGKATANAVPKKIQARRRRRYEQTLQEFAAIEDDAEALKTFNEDITILNYALYGEQEADESTVMAHIEQASSIYTDPEIRRLMTGPKTRLMTIPFGGKQTLRETHEQLDMLFFTGKLKASPERLQRLHEIVDRAHFIKKNDPELHLSQF